MALPRPEATAYVQARQSHASGKLELTGIAFWDAIAFLGPPTVLLGMLLTIWIISSATGVLPAYILPSPLAILQEFVANGAVLAKHAWVTTLEAAGGLIIGTLAAIFLSSVFTLYPPARDAFLPYALAARAIPLVVFTPIFVVMFGRGTATILLIVAFAVYFSTFLGLLRGLNAADPELDDLLHTFSVSRLQCFRLIQLPASLPFLFASLKISASASFVGAIVTEWIGSNAGLGYLIVVSSQYYRLPMMWAAILLAAALTLVFLGVVALIEKSLGRLTLLPGDK